MWNLESMMNCTQYEEWKVKENVLHENKYYSVFTDEYAKTIKGFFEKENFELAKKKSKELYDNFVSPNCKYKVARYFDDVFECYVTGELTKREACEKKNQLNKMRRCYVSHDVVKCI